MRRPTPIASALFAAVLLGVAPAIWAQPTGPATSESASETYPIDLPTALRLAGAQNLDVRNAVEKLAEAKANSDGARFQFFPWVSAGISYRRHDNLIQDTAGSILEVHKQSYAPGGTLVSQLDLGDAIFKRLAAKQLELAAGHALEAQRQDSVAAAAGGYFALTLAQAAVGVAQEAVRISTDYEAQIKSAVAAGIAFRGDLLRVSVQAEHNRITLRQAAEQQRLASARLAQILHLDPALELFARDADLVPLRMVDTGAQLGQLIQRALSNRPELNLAQALVAAARENEKGAVYGPLIPSVSAQIFAGGLGGGRNWATGNFGHQEDYFVGFGWRVGPGGLFDSARQRAAKARLNSSRIGADKVRDEVVRQVVEAVSHARSLGDQIDTARRALGAAEEGLKLAQQRQEFGVGIVLENIQAQQDLTRTRNDYLKIIAEFNQAQYDLMRALGTDEKSNPRNGGDAR